MVWLVDSIQIHIHHHSKMFMVFATRAKIKICCCLSTISAASQNAQLLLRGKIQVTLEYYDQ